MPYYRSSARPMVNAQSRSHLSAMSRYRVDPEWLPITHHRPRRPPYCRRRLENRLYSEYHHGASRCPRSVGQLSNSSESCCAQVFCSACRDLFLQQDGYRVTAFTIGFDYLDGLRLSLEHIEDQSIRPLDCLFEDHFLQGLLMHVKGAGPAQSIDGEVEWDHELALAGSFNLSDPMWLSQEATSRPEIELGNRLHTHRTFQDLGV